MLSTKENKVADHLPSINRQSTAAPMQRTSTAFSSGPGSYEVSRKLGIHSNVFKNTPIITIPKSNKSNKMYISRNLNTDLLGTQSPGSCNYSPSTALVERSYGSTKLGTDKRILKIMSMDEDSSPGPIYNYDINSVYPTVHSNRGSLPRAPKCTRSINDTPSAGLYNPKLSDASPTFVLKGRETSPNQYLEHLECTYRGKHSPGPAIYNPPPIKSRSAARFSTLSKEMIIRNFYIANKELPGPGTYLKEQLLSPRKIKLGNFSKSVKKLDIRDCNLYLDRNAYELNRFYD